MKKRRQSIKIISLIVLILIIAMITTIIATTKSKIYATDEFSYGGLKYTIKTDNSDIILEITGTSGVVTSDWYQNADSPIKDYKERITKVVVTKNATEIGDSAFEGCTSLKLFSVEKSSRCTKIGKRAFAGCTSLEMIRNADRNYTCSESGCSPTNSTTHSKDNCGGTISGHRFRFGGNVLEVGEEAFMNCTSLTRIIQNDKLTKIGARAFLGCTGIDGFDSKGDKEHSMGFTGNGNIEVGKDAYRYGGYPEDYDIEPEVTITQSVQQANTETYYTDGIGKVTMNITSEQAQLNDPKDYIVCLDTTGSMYNKDSGGYVGTKTKLNIAKEALQILADTIYAENPENRLAIVLSPANSYLYMNWRDGSESETVKMAISEISPDNRKGSKTYGYSAAYYTGSATNYDTGIKTMADVIMQRNTGKDRNVYAVFMSDGFANKPVNKNTRAGKIISASEHLKGTCEAVWSVAIALDLDNGGEEPKDPDDEFAPDEDTGDYEDFVPPAIDPNDKSAYLKYINTYWGETQLFHDFPVQENLEERFKAFMKQVVSLSTMSITNVKFKSVLNTDIWEFYSDSDHTNSENLTISDSEAVIGINGVGAINKEYNYYIRLKDDKRGVTDPALLVSNNLSAEYIIAGGANNGKADKKEYTEELTLDWEACYEYEIEYHGNGATSGTMENSTHKAGEDVVLSENKYGLDYSVIYDYNYSGATNSSAVATGTFNNWKSRKDDRYFNDKATIQETLCESEDEVYHLDAQWTLGSVTLPSPTRDGYTCIGWSTDSSSDTAEYNKGASYTPTQDRVTLYAIWEPYSVTVTLRKTDSITGEGLTGATFGLYEYNGSTYVRKSDVTDNGDGTYTTAKMVYRDGEGGNDGKFKIIEERAPQYYTTPNPAQEKEVTITQPGHNHYTTGYDMTNEPNKIKVKTIKTDSETGNRIEGATFAIYEWNNIERVWKLYSRNENRNETDETMHFQQDRTYLSEWLYANKTNEGKFKIVEARAPEGYYGDYNNGNKKENDFTITADNNGKTITLQNQDGVYKNTRVKGTINVNKIDRETQRYLSQGDATLDGAEYGLYAAEDIYHKDTVTGKIYNRDQLVQRKTITNGTLTYENIEIGRYYVKEITPPEGYLKDETKYEINMNYEGETVAHLTREKTVIEQIKKQAFKIKKVSSNSSSTELPPLLNAGFKIYLIKDIEGVKNGTIKPSNNGQYIATDFIGYDFSKERTALDYSRNTEGERIPEIYSDKEGNVTSPELAYGKYVIIESTVPENMSPIDPFIVTIKEDSRTPQNQRVVVDLEFEALIRIIKKDTQTGKTVKNKNAKYRIWNKSKNEYVEQAIAYPIKITYGTEENPYEINEKGEFVTPLKLQIGEYELREIEAPEGYILTGHEGKIENGTYTEEKKQAIKFNVKSNAIYYEDPEIEEIVIDVEQHNDEMLGELEITKTGESLKGTKTREDGTIEPIYEEIKIEGVEFEIYAKEDIYSQDNQGTKLCEKDQLVRKITTNAEGKAYQDNLPIGKYYVKEVKTAEGFVQNQETKEFEIKYQGQEKAVQKIEMNYKNERQKIDLNGKGGLEIEKIANKTIYKPGEEITYTIKITNTTAYKMKNIKIEEKMIEGKFEEIETDNITKTGDKTIEIKELKPGEKIELKYKTTIKEPENEETKEKLEKEKIKITNKIEGTGKIEKPDPIPGNPPKEEDISGEGEEEIYITNKNLVIEKEALKEEYEIGETVQYTIKITNNGKENITKILIEEKLLNGKFVGIEEANKNGTEIAEEGQKIAINKIEPGETITLRYEYTITESTKVEIEENGKIKLGNTIKATGKIETPDPENPDNIKTEEIEDESTEKIEITEKDKNHIGINKKDIETGETIEGATIGLYAGEDIKDKQGNIVIAKDTLIEKAKTDQNGKAKYTIDLPLGKYYIKEIEAPEGYNLSQEKVEIDGTYQGQETQQISISKTLGNRSTAIKVHKKDIKGKFLKGAKLEIIDEKGNIIDQWETTEGTHIFRKLEKGKTYTLKETEPAKGYATAKQIRFAIDSQERIYYINEETEEGITMRELNSVDYVEMIDETTKVKIEVVDKETGKPIPGIKVEIKDKETGETIYEYETDEKSKEIEGIPIGEYEIITTDPENRGYVTETEEMRVKDTDKLQTVKIEQGYTKVEISLKDEETKEILKEGKFEIIDERGEVLKTLETKDGIINLERLPLGKYTIHQTEAPKGYFTSKDIKVEIRNTEEKQIFEILNRKKVINYGVQKTLNSITLNGQNVEITDNKLTKLEIKSSEIKKTELIARYNIKVTNEGEVEGKVTVLETIPEGYEIVESPEYWSRREDGKLQAEVELEAGQSKDLSIALRWTNIESNLGTGTNKAELEGQEEQTNKEDDKSEATIVISIKTGIKVSLIIVMMIIISLGICGYMYINIMDRKGQKINKIKFLNK